MVSGINIASMFFTLAVSTLLPIVLWIVFARKYKGISKAVIVGTIGFVLPQLIIRLPILQMLSANKAWVSFCNNNAVLSFVIYALSAALFETAGRLLVLRGILKNQLSYYTGLGSGLGHGGIESISLIGITYINNIILSFMINAGTLPDIEGIEGVKRALANTHFTEFLLAGFERAFTIPFHIMLSVLLCLLIIKRKTLLGSLICILIHFAADFIILLLSSTGISLWFVEGVLMVIAILSVFIIFKLKPCFFETEIHKDSAETVVG